MEKFEELKNKIYSVYIPKLTDKAKEVNLNVYNFLNKDSKIEPKLFNDLYIMCHMSREELKFLIYDICMRITKEYNLICDSFHRKTPDILYVSLIETCNHNLMIDISRLLNEFEIKRDLFKI
jgi:hypothetical protein